MQKDVIYIDVEDDITAIIGKLKAAKENVVALVPPKRIGLLQSAVNLRLLSRTAENSGKKLVLITGNEALTALAAAAKIPVAKNLQSQPELAEISALQADEGDDIIDGASLPIGEHAKMAGQDDSDADATGAAMAAALAEAPAAGAEPPKAKVKSGTKVPNFNSFRKKLFLGIGALVLLIGFFVWATFIAPRATVIISTKTTPNSVNQQVTLSTKTATDTNDNTIRAISNEKSDTKSVDFTATGKKDAGKKATGTVKLSTNSASFIASGGNIPAGTTLKTSGGLAFTTDSSVTLTLGNLSDTTTVTAAENGSKYNAATGGMSGAPSGVDAELTGPTSGGVTKMVTVVTAADVQKAKEDLVDEDTNDIRDELKGKFSSDTVVIDESFAIDYSEVDSEPAIGEEAPDKDAKLTAKVTYRLYGAEKNEISGFLDNYLSKQLEGKDDQRVYDNGAGGVQFQEAKKKNDGATATLIATAQIGPKIEEQKIKDLAKGKRYGEIQQSLESIQGVDSVDVKFFPFWLNTVPNDDGRITVETKGDDAQ